MNFKAKVTLKATGRQAGHSSPERELESICIIGLGYVGLTLAVAMASAGYRVRGVEKAQFILDALKTGHAHFRETGLDELVAEHLASGQLTCSDLMPEAGEATTYIITVGTPLTKDGSVDLASLKNVLAGIAEILQDGDLVILRSTVKTGTTRNVAQRILDQTGRDYDLAFCPERTLEGKAITELTSLPQIVGALTSRALARTTGIFNVFAPQVIQLKSFEAAEIVKLINNTQRDLMFAFANEVAEVCDAIGVSAMEVIDACCTDYPRSKIPMPGLVGGPCLEKDTHILAEGLREVHYTPRIALAGRRLNEELPRSSMIGIANHLARLGVDDIGRGKVAILGLAFKGRPETDDLRGTMAEHVLDVARARWPQGRYCAYDPVVAHDAFSRFAVAPCATVEAAFDDASLVLILNNHEAFAAMPLSALAARMSAPGLVYDYWNLFDAAQLEMPAGRYYGGLGTLATINGSTHFSADGTTRSW